MTEVKELAYTLFTVILVGLIGTGTYQLFLLSLGLPLWQQIAIPLLFVVTVIVFAKLLFPTILGFSFALVPESKFPVHNFFIFSWLSAIGSIYVIWAAKSDHHNWEVLPSLIFTLVAMIVANIISSTAIKTHEEVYRDDSGY